MESLTLNLRLTQQIQFALNCSINNNGDAALSFSSQQMENLTQFWSANGRWQVAISNSVVI